jgi:hypothetical protein
MVQLLPFTSFTGETLKVARFHTPNFVASEGPRQKDQVDLAGHPSHSPFENLRDREPTFPKNSPGAVELSASGCRRRACFLRYDGSSPGKSFLAWLDHF